MSWNLPRTINNLEQELNHKTQFMDSDNNGTIFEKNITADKFIITGGGSSLLYLMSDGSTSSGSNVGTGVKNPMIDNLNANDYSLTNVGTINGFDIGTIDSDLTIVKDKTLHIQFPSALEGTVFNNNVYAEKFIISGGLSPPGYLLSDGSISSNSGDNTRITALETKTQNISSTSSKLSLSKSFELKLDTSDFFAIRSIDSMLNYLIFNPTITMLYTDLNMNAKNINNVSSITISGFASSNFFLKTDGTIDENDYITASSTEITNLQNKTQNITASSIETTFNKNNTFILSTGGSDYFTIRDDNSPASNLKVGVSNTSITFQQPLFMNGNVISLVSDPVSGRDASNRNYVDGVGALKLNLDGTNAMTGALNMNSKNIVGAGSVSATSLTLGGASTSILRGDGSTISGTASQYVMGNGTVLTATYPTMTTGSFTVQWTGGAGGTTVDRTIEWRRLSDGTITTVWLKLPAFTVNIGTANSIFGVLCTTATVPSNLSVLQQPNLPIITTFNGVVQCGWLVHFGTSLGVQPANKGPAVANTVCGIPNVAIVSYMI